MIPREELPPGFLEAAPKCDLLLFVRGDGNFPKSVS